jgi:hypothetical protein
MSPKPTYETQRIDHLGIVAGICGEISLLDILLVKQNGEVMLRQLLNLRPAQEQVIVLLGPQVQKCYLFGL